MDDAVVFRLISLDHHLTRLISPAGAPGRLGQQLKRPLPGTVIILVQRQIRCQNTDQRYIRKIMPFHDHLGSHQNIRPFISKS